MLGTWAQQQPDVVAIVAEPSGERLTYRELDERSTRLAHHLRDLGCGRGDTIAILMDNTVRYQEAMWAALRSGMYFTTINTHLAPDEAAYLVTDSSARVLIASDRVAPLAEAVAAQLDGSVSCLMTGAPSNGFASYDEALAASTTAPLTDEPAGDFMLYSSGTTGRPKAIRRPLVDASINDHVTGVAIGQLFGFSQDTVYLSNGPMYHTMQVLWTLVTTAHGGTNVLLEKFDPLLSLTSVERHAVTHAQWVPTMFIRMLRLAEEERTAVDVSSLEVALHSAAPCPAHVKQAMIEWFGPILFEYYGGTEGVGFSLISSDEWLERPGSVGIPLGMQAHICDDDGSELPPGEPGVVYFEPPDGVAVQVEYVGDEVKTQGMTHPANPSWKTFGDIGVLDEDGYLYLRDRRSYTIVSGGVKIYPREVEDVLLQHEAVGDVAVFGVPNEEFGEEVKAVVELREGVATSAELEAELIAFCRDRIAHFKCPRSVDFEARLPRLDNGKLYKRQIRDRYWGNTSNHIIQHDMATLVPS